MRKIVVVLSFVLIASLLFATDPPIVVGTRSASPSIWYHMPVAATDGLFATLVNPAAGGMGNAAGLGYMTTYDNENFDQNYALFLNTSFISYVFNNSHGHDSQRLATSSKLFRNFFFGAAWDWEDPFDEGNLSLSMLYRPHNAISLGLTNTFADDADQDLLRAGIGLRPLVFMNDDWGNRFTLTADFIRGDDTEEPDGVNDDILDPIVGAQIEPLNGFMLGGAYDIETETASINFSLGMESLRTGSTYNMHDDNDLDNGSVYFHLSERTFRKLYFDFGDLRFYDFKIPERIVDVKETRQFGPFVITSESETTLQSVLKKIERIKDDPEIDGIVIQSGNFSTSYANFLELRDAFLDMKKAGKKIVFYYDGISNINYAFAASIADRIYLNPMGGVDITGFSSSMPYVRELLDMIGVKVYNFRSHEYKTAANIFSEKEMTDAEREAMDALLQGFYDDYVAMIRHGRGDIITNPNIDQIVDNGPYFIPEDILEMKLVDGLIYRDELMDTISRDFGEAELIEDLPGDMVAYDWSEPYRERVAIIYARGNIHMGKGDVGSSIGAETLSKAIRNAREDDDVAGIILRVDSGGGSALASDIILREVKLCKQEGKPFIVTFGGVAASGGYYISCYADEIIAQPTTITGSIGVVGFTFSIEETLAKIGINFSTVKKGEHADIGSMTREMTEAEQQLIEKSIKHTYDVFVNHVADGRDMTYDQVHKVAKGRVWTGTQAKEHGLVDTMGGLQTAYESMMNRLNSERIDVVEYRADDSNLPKIPIEMDLPGVSFLGVKAPEPIQKMMDQAEFLQKVSNERFLYLIPYIMNTEMQ